MVRTRPFASALFSCVALVMLVQMAVAGPVCHCAEPDDAMPCHAPQAPQAPVDTAPGACCQHPPDATGPATVVNLDCCRMGGLGDVNQVMALLPVAQAPATDSAVLLPVVSALAAVVLVRPVAPARCEPPPTAAVWLRNSVLLL